MSHGSEAVQVRVNVDKHSLFLLSLAGLPLTSGYLGKFAVVRAGLGLLWVGFYPGGLLRPIGTLAAGMG